MFQNILLVVVGAALVVIGADKLTDGAVGVARRFRISEMVIGLTIVAFGTSLPEFVVSLLSSINHVPAMCIGNVLGSNIFNTLMIVGLTAVFSPIVVAKSTVSKDIPFSLMASIALPALALDAWSGVGASANILSRGDGIALLCFFAVFLTYSFSIAHSDSTASQDNVKTEDSLVKMILFIVLGIAGLIFGGEMFVEGATEIARGIGVSEGVIGLTLVAGGTSLPELATSIVAARKGQGAMAIGNVIGSNLFNIFWILGFCATVFPLPVTGIEWTDFAMLLLSSFLFWLFARTSHRIGHMEGTVLVAVYVAYIVMLIRSL